MSYTQSAATPRLWHVEHVGRVPSHRVFRSWQILQAVCMRRRFGCWPLLAVAFPDLLLLIEGDPHRRKGVVSMLAKRVSP